MKHKILGLAAIVLATAFSAPTPARATPEGYVAPSSTRTISCNIGESCLEHKGRYSRDELRYAGMSSYFVSFGFIENKDDSRLAFNIYYPANQREFNFGDHHYRILKATTEQITLEQF